MKQGSTCGSSLVKHPSSSSPDVQANEESRLPARLFAILVQCRLAALKPGIKPTVPQAFRNKLLGPTGYIALGELGKLKVVVRSAGTIQQAPQTNTYWMSTDVKSVWTSLECIGIEVPKEYQTK